MNERRAFESQGTTTHLEVVLRDREQPFPAHSWILVKKFLLGVGLGDDATARLWAAMWAKLVEGRWGEWFGSRCPFGEELKDVPQAGRRWE